MKDQMDFPAASYHYVQVTPIKGLLHFSKCGAHTGAELGTAT